MNKGRCQKHPEEGEGEGWSKYKGGNPTTHRCLEADLSFSVVTPKSKTIFEKFRQILKTSRKPENKIWRKLTHIWFLRNRTLFMNKPTVGQIYEWQSEGNALEWSRRFDFITERCTFLALIFGSFPNDSITVMTENFLSYFLGLSVSFFASTACFLSSSNNSLDLGSFFLSSRYWWKFFSLMYCFILRWGRDSSWISSFWSSLRISFCCSFSFSTWISSFFLSLICLTSWKLDQRFSSWYVGVST